MVLIQLLLPTSGAASADGLAPLAQTRRELADRFTGVELEAKAVHQWEAIEERRRALVELTFSAAASRAE